ncbi:MAG: tetratricopeptide repeat protein [Saprospiraceae bacterium]
MSNTLYVSLTNSYSKRIDDLLEASEKALQVSYDEAIPLVQEAFNFVDESTDDERKCKLNYTLSRIYFLKGNYTRALDYAKNGVDVCKNSFEISPLLRHKIFNLTGVIYQEQVEVVSATAHFMKAIEALKGLEAEYKQEVAGVYMNMAIISYHNRNFTESLEALEEATRYMEELDFHVGMFRCYNTYGNVYNELNELDNAEIFYQKSLKIVQKLNNSQYLANTYSNLSNIAEKRTDFEKALRLVRKSISINQLLNSEAVIAVDYRRIGVIYFELGRVEKGIEYLEKSYELSTELGSNKEALVTLNSLADACSKAKLWEQAYHYRTLQGKLKSKMFSEEKTRVLSEMQVHHQLERKQRETKILKASEEKIRVYADKLAESNQELERFARVASHDMKEPLRMIKSYLSLIKRKVDKLGDEDLNEYMFFAIDGADRMQVLITEILKLAAVQSKSHKMSKVDMNDVVFMAKNNLRQVIAERNVTVNLPSSLPIVEGNMALLIQLFQNLIANGVKYNRSETPQIDIKMKEQENTYQFEVIDNGIGIEEAYFDKVFEMLTRLHNRTEFEGTGIGLATCKRIVERHEGKIWVTSEHGKGSNFQFYMPKAKM